MAGIEAEKVARTGSEGQISIQPLRQRDHFIEAVELQKTIWGFADNELLPLRLFVVSTKIGGQVFGAFDGSRMVGFCIAIPGIKTGGRGYYLHSHMLGVLPEYSNRGIGRMLKLAQRDDALARGIALMEWTFDPLEIKNAYFNMERLGAIVRRYVLNQYGITQSPLHGGLPTDRCVAEWWMDSRRVRDVIAGGRRPEMPVEARISVPSDIALLRTADAPKARAIQKSVTEQFLDNFSRGLAVIGFERSDTAGTYLLGRWEETGKDGAE